MAMIFFELLASLKLPGPVLLSANVTPSDTVGPVAEILAVPFGLTGRFYCRELKDTVAVSFGS